MIGDSNHIEMDWDEFMEHVEATGSTLTRVGDISTANGWYLGREVEIGTYNHATSMATLHWI